jgi:hypothetical protein
MSTSTLKSFRILLAYALGLVLSAALLVTVRSSAAPKDCITTTIEGSSGFVHQTWEAAPDGTACLILILQIQEQMEGTFNIGAGWVFTAPLKINGAVVPTSIVEGQLAPQIDPVSFPVVTGTTIVVIEPNWNPSGTEVGFWWNYVKNIPPATIVYTETISLGTRLIVKNWTGNPRDLGKLIMIFPSAGIVNIESGWTFDIGITLNGQPVETYVKDGQTALQILSFKLEVNEGDKWSWSQSIMPNGLAELGLNLTYSPRKYLIFLPILAKPLEILQTEVELNENQEIQVKSTGWPQAISGQEACLIP